MKTNFRISKSDVEACHNFCDRVRSASSQDEAEAITIEAEEYCIIRDLRGSAGMWFMSEVCNAYEETFGFDFEGDE